MRLGFFEDVRWPHASVTMRLARTDPPDSAPRSRTGVHAARVSRVFFASLVGGAVRSEKRSHAWVGPGLPSHLPILYRKRNSNPRIRTPFAAASGLKGFMPASFGSFLALFHQFLP